MNREIARRALFQSLGSDGQDAVLCAHATTPHLFARDPVFPDEFTEKRHLRLNARLRQGLKKIEEARPDPARIGVAFKKTRDAKTVVLAYDGKHAVRIHSAVYARAKLAHSADPKHFHRDLWRAAYRYKTLGMFSGMSASVSPAVYRRIRKAEPRAVECFASFFNHTLPGGYYGLFPDVESVFGCRGSFFSLAKPLPLMLCNPPFERCVMNAFVRHLLKIMREGPGSAVVVLPAFDTADRSRLNASGTCRSKYPVDYETDVDTEALKTWDMTKWHGLYCKEGFPYVDLTTGRTVNYTSTLALYASSYKRPGDRVLAAVRKALPPPDM